MNITVAALFVFGLFLLIAGAELLVRGSAKLAMRIGISSLVVGLTVVAFGTSSPELAVSLQAGLAGQGDIALGNVVGSNIFNVLVILGISALLIPLTVSQQLVRLEVPIMIAVSLLLLVMALDGQLGMIDGLMLFLGIIGYTAFAIIKSRNESTAIMSEYEREFGPKITGAKQLTDRAPVQIAIIIAGLVMLVIGSNWLVDGAVVFAQLIGVSELVIGLTIIAAGTSLPEVATSIVATLRGERDIAVGNVVGSNIFNILCILGLASIFTPGGLAVGAESIFFNIPVMVAVAIACLPIFAYRHLISRWNGVLFLSFYIAYVVYLIFDALQHAALPAYTSAMLGFVLPITVVTLIVLMIRGKEKKREELCGDSKSGH